MAVAVRRRAVAIVRRIATVAVTTEVAVVALSWAAGYGGGDGDGDEQEHSEQLHDSAAAIDQHVVTWQRVADDDDATPTRQCRFISVRAARAGSLADVMESWLKYCSVCQSTITQWHITPGLPLAPSGAVKT